MEPVSQPPFQPEVDTETPSPTSSICTTPLTPRPVHLAASGLWKPTPTLTPNFSHPTPTPAPIAQLSSDPSATPAPTVASPTKLLPALTQTSTLAAPLPSLTAAHSHLKPGDIHPALRPTGYPPTTSSSTSSRSYPKGPPQTKNNESKRSRGRSIREGAFYAFVLLPLSCWYTRGGKRLNGSSPGPSSGSGSGSGSQGAVGGRQGHAEMVEWEGDEYAEYETVDQEEDRMQSRRLPELQRPMNGRRNSLGQVGGAARGGGAGRRQSFTAPVPPGVILGHGRRNSFSTARGSACASGVGFGTAFGPQRRECADYGVDRGAAAVDGEWDSYLERERELAREMEGEFERSRSRRHKSRAGSTLPLRRRKMSEV